MKRMKKKFEAGVSAKLLLTMVLTGIVLIGGIGSSVNTSSSVLEDKSIAVDNLSFSMVPHPIFGTAEYDGGGWAVGASVEVVSSEETLTDTVGSSGEWQVDCGDPGPGWPEGTDFTIYINGTGNYTGWFGKANGTVSGYYNDMGVIILYFHENEPPDPPMITGPHSGYVCGDYEFSFITTDPENDNVFYWIEWGDGTNTSWLGPYISGEFIDIINEWHSAGNYEITVKSKDINDDESEWSEPFEVNITEIESQLAVIAGLITDLSSCGDFIKFKADKLLYIGFKPFYWNIYTNGEQIVITEEIIELYQDSTTIVGLYRVAVVSNVTSSQHNGLRNAILKM